MRAFDEICRLNPRVKEMLMEADLNAEEQLLIFKQNADPFWGSGIPIHEQVRQLEAALRNHLKQYPPLTARPRRGRL